MRWKWTAQRWQGASGKTSASAPTMPADLSPVTILTPLRPRSRSESRNSRQLPADSVYPSAQPMTSRHPSSFAPVAMSTATLS